MYIEQLVGKRLADAPKDAMTPGHTMLLRGGYIRQIGQGIFALLPLGFRIAQKVEAIIREEMNFIGGQEIQMPVVSPADLWLESGRYETVGPELLRFEDRTGHPCVLNMTHEEVVVEVARSQVDSYRHFPFMLYQIQTKYRDEARSRGGLIRVREFVMKDAYSFHRTQEDLAEYYQEAHAAYTRIFRRCGLRNFVDIESDSGMMGGNVAHEFMLVTPVGEDTLILCPKCGYRANREVAVSNRKFEFNEELEELNKVHTPAQKTIEEVTGFLGKDELHACKCVAFVGNEEKAVFAFVRGDMEVNLPKLRKASGFGDLRPMHDEEFEQYGTVAGFVGPLGLKVDNAVVVFDESVAHSPNLIIGANETDYHTTGFNFRRDLPEGTPTSDITDVREGEACRVCGEPLNVTRGIEVGNIFQLGTKYSHAMTFQYHEEDGSLKYPIMGCYGIGVGRTFASVAEESRDDNGPIWPISIAPFRVQVCCLQAKDEEIAARGVEIYDELRALGLDPLLDKRQVGAGFMFADADLIGAPIRIILSRRNLAKGVAEMKYRLVEERDFPKEIALDELPAKVQEIVQELELEYSSAAMRM
ncbi:proline--tRNA ligase [bacterium]|nr:proline--tRNA ligase [bacterium]